MLKVGLEKELFVVNNEGELIIAGNVPLPYDEGGLLAEARSKPYNNIIEAVYSLRAECHRISLMAQEDNLKIIDDPIAKISRSLETEMNRGFQKPLTKYKNYFGHEFHRNSAKERLAGLHISLSDTQIFTYQDSKGYMQEFSYNKSFDYIEIFTLLDRAFKEEIRRTKRKPGFYELKDDGRIEYRSLPSNANLDKLIDVLKSFL